MILHWFALGTTLIMVAVGQTFFKLFAMRTNWLLLGLAGISLITATLTNYIALQGLALGLVYMSTALTHLLVLLLSRVVLKETLTRDHAIAMSLIISGLIVYAV